jgi:hypothetical protein
MIGLHTLLSLCTFLPNNASQLTVVTKESDLSLKFIVHE